MAAGLVGAGADGLVLFNRFYSPDIDLATLRVTKALPLSTAAELPLTLVWTALLSRRVGCSLAAGRGVESEAEVVKCLLVGADVVMTASALLRHGPQHLTAMKEGLVRWLLGEPASIRSRRFAASRTRATSPTPTPFFDRNTSRC